MARYSAEEMEQKANGLAREAAAQDVEAPEPDEFSPFAGGDYLRPVVAMLKQASQRERAWEQLRAWLTKCGDVGPDDCREDWARAGMADEAVAEMSRLDAEPEGE